MGLRSVGLILVEKVAKTETIVPGVHADFNIDGKLLGIEVIDAVEIMGGKIEFKLPEVFVSQSASAR